MSNLQGWSYLESLLAEQFYKEYKMSKNKGQTCEMCKNDIDYILTTYKGFGEVQFRQRLCARHADATAKKSPLKFIMEPVDQFKEYT